MNDVKDELTYVTIGKTKVPLSAPEAIALAQRLDGHVAKNGVLFGFFADVLRLSPDLPRIENDECLRPISR